MRYYTKVTYADGMADRACRIDFETRARTRNGIMRALAKAIAERLGTDVVDVTAQKVLSVRNGGWPNVEFIMTTGDSRYVVDKTRDALFDALYS